jgi:uncharacterized membrane protein HdeD (DUF308 family)
MRNSRAYSGFKTFNGVVFIVLGVIIIFELVRTVGLRVEAFSGFVLGLALIALGIYRTMGFLRSRK